VPAQSTSPADAPQAEHQRDGAELPRPGRLAGGERVGEEHRAQALGQPLDREDRGDVLQPAGHLVEGQEHAETNSRTSAIGVTVADADRPLRASVETTMPSSVQAAAPSTDTHANVSQSAPEGGSMP
jgi:hypothetical protein